MKSVHKYFCRPLSKFSKFTFIIYRINIGEKEEKTFKAKFCIAYIKLKELHFLPKVKKEKLRNHTLAHNACYLMYFGTVAIVVVHIVKAYSTPLHGIAYSSSL